MIDRDKVIEGLKELCEYLFHEYKVCYHGDVEDTYNRFLIANNALELLKEQEPVRPKKWIPKGQILVRVRGYYCPVCDTGISQGDRFFHRCGRAMKWDE